MVGFKIDIGRLLIAVRLGQLKIWNMKSLACIRTMECGYAICSSFLPGDRHVRILNVTPFFASYLVRSLWAQSREKFSYMTLHRHPL